MSKNLLQSHFCHLCHFFNFCHLNHYTILAHRDIMTLEYEEFQKFSCQYSPQIRR